jgi:hypothetical protein
MLPDLIGVNFDQYYNFGAAGACHNYMLTQLIQANELYKFNAETDFITVGTTGFGRFTYVEHTGVHWDWKKNGDIFPEYKPHPAKARLWAREFDSHHWGVYRSLISVKTIKTLLELMGVKHKIYSAIYNKHLDPIVLKHLPLDAETIDMIHQFYQLVDTRKSIDELLVSYTSTRGKFNYPWLDGDGHPTVNVNYDYLKKYFPEYDTELVREICRDHIEKMQSIPTREEYIDYFVETFMRKYRTDHDKIISIKNHPYYVRQT